MSYNEERKKHIQILIKHGLLIPFDDNLKIYHGRAGWNDDRVEWEVDPNFDNAGNNTGNANVYGIPCISTADFDVAKEFAENRCYNDSQHPEVFRIMTNDNEALIFNNTISFSKMTNQAKKEIANSLVFLTSETITKFVPLPFEFKGLKSEIRNILNPYLRANKSPLTYDDAYNVEKILKNTEKIQKLLKYHYIKDEEISNLVLSLLGTSNSQYYLRHYPTLIMGTFALQRNLDKRKDYQGEYPINLDYIASFLAENHIVGVKNAVDSVTVNKVITGYFLFDLEKINTEKVVLKQKKIKKEKYNDFISALNKMQIDKSLSKKLQGTPEEIMNELAYNSSFSKNFEISDGNWEGFTIGQHTESVLRVLDDSFGDLPDEIKVFLRLALLTHDIDKGVLRENGSYVKGNDNISANKFYDELGVSREIQKLLKFVIRDSQQHTSDFYLRNDLNALQKIKEKAKNLLTEIFGAEAVSNKMITCLSQLCLIKQTCDSGAYTRYGITRTADNVYHFNGNDSFTASFVQPTDLRHRKQRFINPLKPKTNLHSQNE